MNYPADESIWERLREHTWKYRRRSEPVRLLVLHATRGAVPIERQYEATKNWQLSPSNRFVDGEEWASMSSYVIGHDGRLCQSVPDEFYPAYSAGHMDPIAISYELAQPDDSTPFAEATLDRAAREMAGKCAQYGIPPIVLPWVSGDNREAPGIARHDRSDNGRKWGKSDPGCQFDDADFERRVRRYMDIEKEIEALKVGLGLHTLDRDLRDGFISDLLGGKYRVRWVSSTDWRRQLWKDDKVIAMLD